MNMYGQDYNSAIALFNHNYNNSSSNRSNDDAKYASKLIDQ